MKTPTAPHDPSAMIHTLITLQATTDRYLFAIYYCLALPHDRQTWAAIWQCHDLTGKFFLEYAEERRQLLQLQWRATS